MDIKKIDTEAINKVANGEYTSGTYVIDDEKKVVSYTLRAGAVSLAVIEDFVKLANHTEYTFTTKFNNRELTVSPGMTEEQVKKSFFQDSYREEKIDTYAINKVANGEYTSGTYVIDDEKKVVSYTLRAGAVFGEVVEKFTELANHCGYTFQTKFNNHDLIASPGMTEKQVVEQFNNKTKQNRLNEETTQQHLANIRQRLAKTSDSKSQSAPKDVETGTNPKSQQQGRKKREISIGMLKEFFKKLSK